MEDWHLKDGWVECLTDGANRSIHSLTHQITAPGKGFSMSVMVGRSRSLKEDGGAGFRVGVKSDINEVKSNVFAGGGIDAGIVGDELFIGRKKVKLTGAVDSDVVILELEGSGSGDEASLTLNAKSWDGTEKLGTVTATTQADNLIGNIAIVSQYTGARNRSKGVHGYRFTDWQVDGDA
ncbi:MAG: twin-arginine translocation pathway signal, partial [Verrucomicrobiota bacterium]